MWNSPYCWKREAELLRVIGEMEKALENELHRIENLPFKVNFDAAKAMCAVLALAKEVKR